MIRKNSGNTMNTLDLIIQKNIWQPNQPLRLHLGCGENYFEGYINIDFPPEAHTVMSVKADVYQDITQLQFPSESVDEIRLHHVFEHFNRVTSLALLIRWSEWLKIGGKLHIETPDIEGCAKIITSNSSFSQKQAIIRHLFGSHEAKWAYHLDGWSAEKFKIILAKLGFEPTTRTWQWQKYPYLPNVEVVSTKVKNLTGQELLEKAKEILYDYIVDDKAESELNIYNIWINELSDLLKPILNNKFEQLHKNSEAPNLKSNSKEKLSEIKILNGLETLYNEGFSDDNPETNGEYFIAQQLISDGDIVFDVGANVGDWSDFVLKHKKNVKLYLFEPILDIYEKLFSRFKGCPNVQIFPFAFNNIPEIKSFFYYKQNSGLSSLHRRSLVVEQQLNLVPETFKIQTKTLDSFTKEMNIEHINFIKIDTEGNEYYILKGAEKLIENQKIDFLQFEYGGTYLESHAKLEAVFNLLTKHKYEIFRITHQNLIHIKFWDKSLENYAYSNYLAIREGISNKISK